MSIGITVLGSGSRGNALVIHTEDSGILIDAGFSRKEMLARFAKSDIDPSIIKALLITHEHGDHVKGARVLADHLDIPTFVNEMTLRPMRSKNHIGKNIEIFEPGTPFAIDCFNIHPFSVPHDAQEPVGFTVTVSLPEKEHTKIGIVTDLGHISHLVEARLQECDALVLECNHDKKMLRDSDRSLNLKYRIAGKFGHLNNDDSISALDRILHSKTKHLVLYHLSSDCNTPDIVAKLAVAKLAELNRDDINLQIASQTDPLETLWL